MKKIILPVLSLVMAILLFPACNADLNDLDAVGTVQNITGKWQVERNDGDVTATYEVEITADPDNANGILISNFINNGATAKVNVVEKTLTVPTQDLSGYEVEGSGSVSDDYQKITFQITIDGDRADITMSPGTVSKSELLQ